MTVALLTAFVSLGFGVHLDHSHRDVAPERRKLVVYAFAAVVAGLGKALL